MIKCAYGQMGLESQKNMVLGQFFFDFFSTFLTGNDPKCKGFGPKTGRQGTEKTRIFGLGTVFRVQVQVQVWEGNMVLEQFFFNFFGFFDRQNGRA